MKHRSKNESHFANSHVFVPSKPNMRLITRALLFFRQVCVSEIFRCLRIDLNGFGLKQLVFSKTDIRWEFSSRESAHFLFIVQPAKWKVLKNNHKKQTRILASQNASCSMQGPTICINLWTKCMSERCSTLFQIVTTKL